MDGAPFPGLPVLSPGSGMEEGGRCGAKEPVDRVSLWGALHDELLSIHLTRAASTTGVFPVRIHYLFIENNFSPHYDINVHQHQPQVSSQKAHNLRGKVSK